AESGRLGKNIALGEVCCLLLSELGIDFGGAATPVEAREALRRMILLAEFASAFSEQRRPAPLKSVALPEKPMQLDALHHLCLTWRNRTDFRDGYTEAARAVEAAAGIGRINIPPQDLESVETFACVETHLLLHAQKIVVEGNSAEALRLAEMRKATFWSREQPAWSLRWSTLELAARLMRASEGVRKNIKKLGPSTAEMVRAYAQFSAPWMMVDRLHRHWESRLLNVDPDEVGGAFDFERLAAK